MKVFGEPDQGAVAQLENCLRDERAVAGALMADHHLGYSMPIGGVVAYQDAISPTGVGFDIACGNMAVKTDWQLSADDVGHQVIPGVMAEIQNQIEFGIGRSNPEPVDDPVMDNSSVWDELGLAFGQSLRAKAANQLGTVGSGNHYVDLLVDEDGFVWVANHFGSRGLGHTVASGFMARAAGREFTDRIPESEEAVVLPTDEGLGEFYVAAMHLVGKYAYAGREYVTKQVLDIIGAKATETVHNHHNFAWKEDGLWVVRKGATPLTTAPAFIGGSMGDISVIVRGKPVPDWMVNMSIAPIYEAQDIGALGSAPHGAGRVMSRTKAAGKFKKVYDERLNKKVRRRDPSTGAIDWPSVKADLTKRGIVVLGAGADEAPGVYKDLRTVLGAHSNIEVLHELTPIGVVMAGDDTFDPYKD